MDFANYMRYHNRKLFLAEYEPVPFCYAIRRPEHYPEGLVSVEAQLADGALADPLYTSVRHSLATRPMRFALNAATNVSFMGDRFLHAFVGHQVSPRVLFCVRLVLSYKPCFFILPIIFIYNFFFLSFYLFSLFVFLSLISL